MGLKRLLGYMLVSSLVVWKCSECQNCSSITDITASNVEVLVNTTGTPCVQCLDGGGQPSAGTAYIAGGVFVGTGNVDGLAETNGVLVIMDPETVLPDGSNALLLDCQSAFRYTNFELFSNNLVPPTANTPSLTVNESGMGSVLCTSANTGLLGAVEVWMNPRMMVAAEAAFNVLTFTNIQRSQAGDYVCVLTSSVTGKTASITVPVVVQYAPEATTMEEATREINLGGDLMLRCDFAGVPTPSVTWVQNSTIQLNESDSRITVTSEAGVSTLRIMGLARDGGGLYSCSFQNVVDPDLDVMVTTVLIRIPPAPVTNLDNITYEEESITVTWANGFDGFSPITGATVEYSAVGGSMMTQTVSSMDPTTVTLLSLTSFTNYNISVSLFNAVGTSDPMSILVQTRSRRLAAPENVTIAVVSSEVLDVSWNPPPSDAGTDSSDNWFVELFLGSGTAVNVNTTVTPDAQTTMVTFSSLDKGTQYSVRVRGVNEVGPGDFSSLVSMETAVDAPTEPQDVRVMGVTSFALRVTWEPPMDNGGRPIMSYIVDVEGFAPVTVPASEPRMLLVRDDSILMESTTYSVNVSAQNTMLLGPPTMESGMTLSIDEPQSILDQPGTEDIMNTSITVSWVDPGGDVDLYLIQYTQNIPPNMMVNETVDGNTTSTTLRGLEPGTSYTVVVFSMNSNGLSIIPSPNAMFSTQAPTPPVVTGPGGEILEGDTVVITCTTTDTRPIEWSERDQGLSLVPPVFEIDGIMNRSTLTINDVRTIHSGVYVCRVREETDTFILDVQIMSLPVMTTTGEPSESSISLGVIIGSSVGGGVVLILIICMVFLLVYCCCCRAKEKDHKYLTNQAMKPDKRTKELFEVSTSYAPVREPTDGNETGISFNMPEDYQAHSSFNTLDKGDKPAKQQQRSASPEPTNASSFRVVGNDNAEGAGSPPGYQDMPPNYNQGTML